MITVKNLIKKYGDRTVLDITQLTFRKGETVAIVGPNGSGKSTLLKIIADVIEKDEGQTVTPGEVYYLPQQSIPFSDSVRKNILFSCKDSYLKEKRCEEILRELDLFHLADKKAKGLSGGECQRLALARVLINKADFLLLDEPSSAADIEGTEAIEKAIKRYKEETGCGIILTTHSPGQACEMADRIIMLNKGKIAEEGSPDSIFTSPETEWGKRFISMWKVD